MSRINSEKIGSIQIVHSVCEIAEKEGLDSEHIFIALENEIAQEISKRTYGGSKVSCFIDRKSGSLSIVKRLMVVDESDCDAEAYEKDTEETMQLSVYNDPDYQPKHAEYDELIILNDALSKYKDQKPEIGKIIIESLPEVRPDYVFAKTMKFKLERIVNFFIRKKQFDVYKSRIGTMVTGVVKKIVDTTKATIIDISGTEAILPYFCAIKSERFIPGKRIKCVVHNVEFSLNRPQIFLSRSSNEFLRELFLHQVSEVYDGIVILRSIARDPGSRSKVIVSSTDRDVDPVGSCIGPRGMVIKNISSELSGEKIDVIAYSSNIETLVENAIKPIKMLRSTVDEERKKIEIVVSEGEDFSRIIGRRGQNVRLLSEVLGYKIDVFSDAEISKRKMTEFLSSAKVLIDALNVEEVIAQLLVTEGFSTVDYIAKCDVSDLAYIEGFDTNIAEEIHKRANDFIQLQRQKADQLFEQYDVDDKFFKNLPLAHDVMRKFLESGLKSTGDVAGSTVDEIKDLICEHEISDEEIEKIIIECRKEMGWFEEV